MGRARIGAMAWAAATAWMLGTAGPAHAQIGVGTWVRQGGRDKPGQMTMTVEACCGGGRRLTYRFGGTDMTMVVESPFDGHEAPVLVGGKPSGETMAITLVDPRHTSTVLKMNGKPFGTSSAAISADGHTLTVVNEVTSPAGGAPVGRSTETWIRR